MVKDMSAVIKQGGTRKAVFAVKMPEQDKYFDLLTEWAGKAAQSAQNGVLKECGKLSKKSVDDIILVTEKEILDAMRFLWERMKLVIEPSGAVSLAGLLKLATGDMKELYKEKKIGLILSGGNIDLTEFFNLLALKLNQK